MKKIISFEGNNIRRIKYKGEWYFSVVDVVGALTESTDAKDYWYQLKKRELQGSSVELSIICRRLKLKAPDGKMRLTDCANTKGIFRIIQSIPSKKAEPFKRWLAGVGYERVQEFQDPSLAQERMRELYLSKGYSDSWIEKRIRSMQIRDELTNEWKDRGVKGKGYSILTNEISKGTFGLTPKEYKDFKGLQRQNLRDHMDSMELVLTMLGEATTTKLTKERDSREFPELKTDAEEGGTVAGNTRKAIEKKIGKSVVSKHNYIEAPQKRKEIE